MATNEVSQKRFQAGIETTPGTAVAATRRIPALFAMNLTKPRSTTPDRTGTRKGRQRPAFGRQRVAGTVTDKLSFEDMPWWLQCSVQGDVSAVGDEDETDEAFTRIYVPSDLGTDLKSFTLEHGEPGNPYESNQVMVQSWTIRLDPDSDDEPEWIFEAELLARGWESTTYTSSLPLRVTSPILARGTKLYVDDAGGTIGSTQVVGKLISASISGNNNIHYKAFAEDENDFAPNRIGFGEVTIDAQITMEFDDDVEFAKFRNTTPQQRLVRIAREGAVIHDDVKELAQIDLYGYWESWTEQEREGNMTATMGLAAYVDASEAVEAVFTVINDVETLV